MKQRWIIRRSSGHYSHPECAARRTPVEVIALLQQDGRIKRTGEYGSETLEAMSTLEVHPQTLCSDCQQSLSEMPEFAQRFQWLKKEEHA